MLTRFEFMIPILTSWIIAGVVYIVLQNKKNKKLPPGSVIINIPMSQVAEKAPGTAISRFGVNFGHMLNDFTLFFLLILSIFDLWYILPPFLMFPFPIWINWIGIFGLVFQFGWQIGIAVYNVNFIPNNKALMTGYVLATGGPYRLVRHPTYVNYVAVTIFLFFATGIWWILIGVIGWFALPFQAQAEENILQQKFGDLYTDYASKTGRFFPKLH